MKVKNILLASFILISGTFLFIGCETEQFLDEAEIVVQNQENAILKSTIPEESISQSLRHIILVEFIDEMTYAQKDGFTSALLDLKDSMDVVEDIEWGENLLHQVDYGKGFTHLYMLTFHSLDDFIAYLYHPSLGSFHEIWMPYVKNVLAFDYISNTVEPLLTDSPYESNLRHLVLFNYKDNITIESKNQVVEEFSILPEEIVQIKEMEWGEEMLLLGVNMNFTDGFLLSFSSFRSYKRYLFHPEHIQFVINYIEPNVEDMLLFDYVVQKPQNQRPDCPHRYPNHRKKNN